MVEGASVHACTHMCLWHTHREKFHGSFLWLFGYLYSPKFTLQVLSLCKVLTAFLTHSVAKGYFFGEVIKF